MPGRCSGWRPPSASITLDSFRGRVFLDPGIWAAALGSPLQFDVRRASYTKPVTITQVIYPPGGGTTARPLPGSVLDGFNGLQDFLALTVAELRRQGGGIDPAAVLPQRPTTRSGRARAARGPTRTRRSAPPTRSRRAWSGACQKGWAADPAESNFLRPPGRSPWAYTR